MKPEEILFTSRDGLVAVTRKTSGLKRHPAHGYPCIMYLLQPKPGTRVQYRGDTVEFMMTWSDLREFLRALAPDFEAQLPEHFQDKCPHRKAQWDARNKKRKEDQ